MRDLVAMMLNPIKLIRRRRRLRQAIEDEVFYLRRIHGEAAHAVAMEKLKRTDLTSWGRQVIEGSVKQLEPEDAAAPNAAQLAMNVLKRTTSFLQTAKSSVRPS